MGSTFTKITSYFPKKEPIRILLIGLDSAGKTTMLYVMKLGEVTTTIPTIGFNVETVEYKNIAITTWDVGGRCKMRPLWRHYYQNTNGIVFVVDSNDRDRIDQVRDELNSTIAEDDLRDKPFLIFANKQDLPNAMTASELYDKLELNKLKPDRKWHLQASIATQNKGIHEGFEWLASAIAPDDEKLSQPFTETMQDSKSMKDKLLASLYSVDLKSYLAKLVQHS